MQAQAWFAWLRSGKSTFRADLGLHTFLDTHSLLIFKFRHHPSTTCRTMKEYSQWRVGPEMTEKLARAGCWRKASFHARGELTRVRVRRVHRAVTSV